jgi:hypothetical protein
MALPRLRNYVTHTGEGQLNDKPHKLNSTKATKSQVSAKSRTLWAAEVGDVGLAGLAGLGVHTGSPVG